jgi:Leucine-rich repeat (LRR) protein
VSEETLIQLFEEAASSASSEIAIEGETCRLGYTGTKRLVGRITALPPEIGKCCKLETLAVRDTDLAKLPTELGQLADLWNLCLQNNKLTELPPAIGGLQKLRRLDVSGNLLESLPTELGQLADLWNLCLQNNKLAELPPAIGCYRH